MEEKKQPRRWPSSVTAARNTYIDNLLAIATGSYLRPEDKEFWIPLYPESAVIETQQVVDDMINRFLFAIDQGSADAHNASRIIDDCLQQLVDISDANGGLMVDTEEINDLLTLTDALCVEALVTTENDTSSDAIDPSSLRQQIIEAIEE